MGEVVYFVDRLKLGNPSAFVMVVKFTLVSDNVQIVYCIL